jgi:hypothetical protein
MVSLPSWPGACLGVEDVEDGVYLARELFSGGGEREFSGGGVGVHEFGADGFFESPDLVGEDV